MTDSSSLGPGREAPGFDVRPPLTFDELTVSSPWVAEPPRRKFQHRWRTHIILFVLTLLTTTFRERSLLVVLSPFLWAWNGAFFNPLGGISVAEVTIGLWYSVPLLTFLTAHELGHYLACRYYRVDATLPYFVPFPNAFTGTLGAVIRIREPFGSKRALFDIGVAGPIAGFVVLVGFLAWGMALSEVQVVPTDRETQYFGEPLLWKAVEWLYFGTIPEGSDVFLHPMAFAAWFGTLATALNLLPFGQLDGGHVTYALLGSRARAVSAATLVVVVGLTFVSVAWVAMAVMLTVMTYLVGLRHPRVIDEDVPLDPGRQLVALGALVIFVLCFMPVPIEIIGTPAN